MNRFFSLHYLLPFIIAGLVITHISVLHISGSTNPLGVCTKVDRVGFYPYFYIKDLFGFFLLLMFFGFFVFFNSNMLGHSDNYIRANPIVTPSHIVPEWYEREVCGAFSRRYCVFYNENHISNQFEVTTIGCLYNRSLSNAYDCFKFATYWFTIIGETPDERDY